MLLKNDILCLKVVFIQFDLGDRIRNKRIEKNIKQETLAFDLGIAQASLSRIENGKEEISIQKLQKLSSILETPISYFTSDPIQIHQQSNKFEHSTGVMVHQGNLEKDKLIQVYENRLQELESKVKRKDYKIEELIKENSVLKKKLGNKQ